MLGYIQSIIQEVREKTLNEDFSEGSYGVSDNTILNYLRDAQDMLLSRLIPEREELFETTQEISLAAQTQAYNLHAECYLGQYATKVEYSDTGNADDYREIPRVTRHDVINEYADWPMGYTIRNGQILISPTPSAAQGKVRVTYVRTLYDLDIRRGRINTNNNTTITLEASAPDPTLYTTHLQNADYISVVTAAGTVENYALPVSAYDGAVTITGTFTGLTLTVGSYVVVGRYATTHPELERPWKRFLTEYAKRFIKSDIEQEADMRRYDAMLEMILNDIIESSWGLGQVFRQPPIHNSFYT